MTETLEELTFQWKSAKNAEQVANMLRLQIEQKVLELCGSELKDKGTNNLKTGLKVVTGYTEKWDNDALRDIRNMWCSNYSFPFREEFKPTRASLEFIEENDKAAFEEIQEALTVSPSKPSFSYVEPK